MSCRMVGSWSAISPAAIGFDHEQPPVQGVAAPVLDRRGEHVQHGSAPLRWRSKKTAPRRR